MESKQICEIVTLPFMRLKSVMEINWKLIYMTITNVIIVTVRLLMHKPKKVHWPRDFSLFKNHINEI